MDDSIQFPTGGHFLRCISSVVCSKSLSRNAYNFPLNALQLDAKLHIINKNFFAGTLLPFQSNGCLFKKQRSAKNRTFFSESFKLNQKNRKDAYFRSKLSTRLSRVKKKGKDLFEFFFSESECWFNNAGKFVIRITYFGLKLLFHFFVVFQQHAMLRAFRCVAILSESSADSQALQERTAATKVCAVKSSREAAN